MVAGPGTSSTAMAGMTRVTSLCGGEPRLPNAPLDCPAEIFCAEDGHGETTGTDEELGCQTSPEKERSSGCDCNRYVPELRCKSTGNAAGNKFLRLHRSFKFFFFFEKLKSSNFILVQSCAWASTACVRSIIKHNRVT